MQTHQLKPTHKRKKAQRIGRGGKRGTYSGRGIKGQTSRAGNKGQPIIRELIKRYPKLRGYRFKGIGKENPVVLNLDILDKKFQQGEKVNSETLLEKKLISKIKREMPKVKILAKGEITKALIFEGCLASKSAKEKIIKAGGKI